MMSNSWVWSSLEMSSLSSFVTSACEMGTLSSTSKPPMLGEKRLFKVQLKFLSQLEVPFMSSLAKVPKNPSIVRLSRKLFPALLAQKLAIRSLSNSDLNYPRLKALAGWFRTLAGSELNWLFALVSSPTVVKTPCTEWQWVRWGLEVY